MTPEQINPPAVVQAAFDEARALAECRELIARRDEAKGEFKDAVALLGQKLIEARRAMPGVMGPFNKESFSPGFLAFVEKTGLALSTAKSYMVFARDPKKREAYNAKKGIRNAAKYRAKRNRDRRLALEEVVELLGQAPDLATARRVIQEELNAIS